MTGTSAASGAATGLAGLPADVAARVGEGARRFLAAPGPRLLHVDGAWVPAASGRTFPAHDPATGAHLADLAEGGAQDVDDAVAAARAALSSPAWRGITPAARARLLWRVGDLIDEHRRELAELETLDQGKTLATGLLGEVPASAEQFRYFAGAATKITGTAFRPSVGYGPPGREVVATTTKEPVGVVGAIVPWNSPLLMASMKLAPALAAGCTVVLKPAEATSLTAVRLVELLVEAGLPPGVVNLVTGYGSTAGARLTEHPDVDKITFTGSTATGRLVVGAARGNFKRCTLELGGKSPAIVLADAELDLVLPGLARGIFANGGQVCVAGSRIYVARAVHEQVVAGLAAHADGRRLGHGLDPASDLGPLVSAEHAARVAGYVDEGVADGAVLAAGGPSGAERSAPGASGAGTTGAGTTGAGSPGAGSPYVRPTVLTGTTAAMRVVREEVFGPVAVVEAFDDVEEVLAVANDTEYGLAASVWTRDLSVAHRISSGVRAGTVWVNCHSYFSPELVKGGWKQSGWGYENGMAGLEGYLETKTTCTVV